MSLIVNNLTIHLQQGFGLTQRYTQEVNRTIHRIKGDTASPESSCGVVDGTGSSGEAVVTQTFGVLKTEIDGAGFYPPGLDGIDWTGIVTISCIGRRSISSASRIIALPGQNRLEDDYYPQGGAFVGGELQPVALSITDHVATLAETDGASGYLVQFFPILQLFADFESTEPDATRVISWRIRGEQV